MPGRSWLFLESNLASLRDAFRSLSSAGFSARVSSFAKCFKNRFPFVHCLHFLASVVRVHEIP